MSFDALFWTLGTQMWVYVASGDTQKVLQEDFGAEFYLKSLICARVKIKQRMSGCLDVSCIKAQVQSCWIC